MSVDQIVQLIQSAIQFGTVILFGAMGEILTEKSGNLNLGVPPRRESPGPAGRHRPAPGKATWHALLTSWRNRS